MPGSWRTADRGQGRLCAAEILDPDRGRAVFVRAGIGTLVRFRAHSESRMWWPTAGSAGRYCGAALCRLHNGGDRADVSTVAHHRRPLYWNVMMSVTWTAHNWHSRTGTGLGRELLRTRSVNFGPFKLTRRRYTQI